MSFDVGCTTSARAPIPSHESALKTRSAPYLSFFTPSAVGSLLETAVYIPKTPSVRSIPSPQKLARGS